jgi:threonine synthase
MQYLSTGGAARDGTLAVAIQHALAADGGLYVPAALPAWEPSRFADARSLPEVAARLLQPFFDGASLGPALPAIAREALDIPAPVVPLSAQSGAAVLELYHGPTAAFKDFGARFLAACLARLDRTPRTILVATSGDTGGAVAAAFHGRPHIRVIVLYPAGGVSPRQEQQLTCWGENVTALRVHGNFDDCQALVKAAFADPRLCAAHGLASANSINLGRLLPQTCYYAAASLAHWRTHGRRASFIVPAGNLGNGVACVWARAMGMPIDDIVLATNANRTITDFLDSGRWAPRPSVATLASAMDVGNPNNMARLLHHAGDVAGVRRCLRAQSVSDEEIRTEIAASWRESGRIACPHTATALRVLRTMPAQARARRDWIVVATAHPAKFEGIVEPIVGRLVEVPAPLAALLDRPRHARDLEPRLDALSAILEHGLARTEDRL